VTAAELVVRPEQQPDLANEDFQRTKAELRAYLKVLPGGLAHQPTEPKLVFPDGTQMELPPNILQALQFVVHHMKRGAAISLVPMTKMLTTNQAAEILNVSRPFLVKLLNEGAIPFTKTGTHHRLRMGDVLEYKKRRDRAMLDALNELAREAQEARNYFDD
jgi:excisionase family DNA binding protein